jgi:type I restriction enzyme M protein
MREKKGRMAVVLPHGVLFRSGAEAKIRKKLLDSGAIEAVIGLAGNLFYGTGIPASILVLRKSAKAKSPVLFINAEEIYTKGRAQNAMTTEQADEIYQLYEKQKQNSFEEEGVTRWVEYVELKENDFNLNIARYVQKPLEEEKITVEEALRDFKVKLGELETAENELELLLEREGFEL